MSDSGSGDIPEQGSGGDAVQDAAKKRAAAGALSKVLASSIGELVLVMSRAPSHKHYALADIEWMVLPAILSGQFFIAESEHKEHGFRAPIAAVTWAQVSAETDERLAAGADRRVRLRPDEWTGGDHLWLIDLVGDPRGINLAVKAIAEGPLKDKPVKVAVRGRDGRAKVETLADLMAAAQAERDAQPGS